MKVLIDLLGDLEIVLCMCLAEVLPSIMLL